MCQCIEGVIRATDGYIAHFQSCPSCHTSEHKQKAIQDIESIQSELFSKFPRLNKEG